MGDELPFAVGRRARLLHARGVRIPDRPADAAECSRPHRRDVFLLTGVVGECAAPPVRLGDREADGPAVGGQREGRERQAKGGLSPAGRLRECGRQPLVVERGRLLPGVRVHHHERVSAGDGCPVVEPVRLGHPRGGLRDADRQVLVPFAQALRALVVRLGHLRPRGGRDRGRDERRGEELRGDSHAVCSLAGDSEPIRGGWAGRPWARPRGAPTMPRAGQNCNRNATRGSGSRSSAFAPRNYAGRRSTDRKTHLSPCPPPMTRRPV